MLTPNSWPYLFADPQGPTDHTWRVLVFWKYLCFRQTYVQSPLATSYLCNKRMYEDKTQIWHTFLNLTSIRYKSHFVNVKILISPNFLYVVATCNYKNTEPLQFSPSLLRYNFSSSQMLMRPRLANNPSQERSKARNNGWKIG